MHLVHQDRQIVTAGLPDRSKDGETLQRSSAKTIQAGAPGPGGTHHNARPQLALLLPPGVAAAPRSLCVCSRAKRGKIWSVALIPFSLRNGSGSRGHGLAIWPGFTQPIAEDLLVSRLTTMHDYTRVLMTDPPCVACSLVVDLGATGSCKGNSGTQGGVSHGFIGHLACWTDTHCRMWTPQAQLACGNGNGSLVVDLTATRGELLGLDATRCPQDAPSCTC